MSGGVDSSTVAALLRSRGESIVGLTMQLWNQRRLPELMADGVAGHRCCSLDDVYDARRVAEHLDFPYYVVNFERQFEETVVRPFVDDYLSGRTPIPCARCNTFVKFEDLILLARQVGAERLATGHYARIRRNAPTGRWELLRAVDRAKDQSYFLFGLTQEQLSRTEFPRGEMSKTEVRDAARAARLPVAEKPESQEICFVPNGDYARFIEAYLEEQGTAVAATPGEIATPEGAVVGRHEGLHRYTVGQRRGRELDRGPGGQVGVQAGRVPGRRLRGDPSQRPRGNRARHRLAGGALLPVGVLATRRVRERTGKPVIGVGGVRTVEDVEQYLSAGAALVVVPLVVGVAAWGTATIYNRLLDRKAPDEAAAKPDD